MPSSIASPFTFHSKDVLSQLALVQIVNAKIELTGATQWLRSGVLDAERDHCIVRSSSQ
jgi:hypothetical protein